MNEQEWIEKLSSEGFTDLETHTHELYTEFPEHTHEKPAIYVVLEGSLTVTDELGSRTAKKGDWFNIAAGATHTAKCGWQTCTLITGHR